MRSIILANGEYGRLEFYTDIFKPDDIVICADGGANYAYRLGVMPSMIIGDMDSILPEVKDYFRRSNIEMKKYPRRKDFTDTQLAMEIAEQLGADEIILLGTQGKRLDHTLANIYSGVEMADRLKMVMHYGPDCRIFLVSSKLELQGHKGDTVSILSLTEKAGGVSLSGFEYPLDNALLQSSQPYTVSNVLSQDIGMITLDEGVLAVFYLGTVE